MMQRYVRAVLTLEIKRLIAYRADFWLRMACTTFGRITLGYAMWKAVFEATGQQQFGGMDFQTMVLYYTLAAFLMNGVVIFGGFLSREIYDGSFSRYFLYPVSVIAYKYCSVLAALCLGVVQIILALFFFDLFIGIPANSTFSLTSATQGIVSYLLAGTLFFFISLNVEFCAFWIDQTFSLSLVLFFLTNFLGGTTLPLSLFPDSVQPALMMLPFPYLIYVPARAFMGMLSWSEWYRGVVVVVCWIGIVRFSGKVLLRRGSLSYSAPGI